MYTIKKEVRLVRLLVVIFGSSEPILKIIIAIEGNHICELLRLYIEY